MHTLPILKAGDSIEIIAPASRCSDEQLKELREILLSWQLNCIVADNIFGHDLLCANTDTIRFNALKNALQRTDTQAIICARGGYGSIRLIPELAKIKKIPRPKLFIGMSDITALNLYLQQKWNWPILHGALAQDKFSAESIDSLQAIVFGKTNKINFQGLPLNEPAKRKQVLSSTITGGNLCLVQASLATAWQIDARGKIIFFEEVGERAYRIDRMLEQLDQSTIFKNAVAILLGDFLGGEEPNGLSLIPPVLERFAQSSRIPVIRLKGIGHGSTNYPLPLGTPVTLTLGNDIRVTCAT